MARQRGTLGCRAAIGAWLLGWPLAAQAQVVAAAPACETRTLRQPEEIIVPFGDADHPELPRQALKIVPGESLCLTGTLDNAGDLVNLELVVPGASSRGPMIEVQLERGKYTVLRTRNTGKGWLYYDALRLETEQDVALPGDASPVAPGLLNTDTWNPSVRKFVLFGFRFGSAPVRTEAPGRHRRRDASRMNASVTFGFWGGERSLKLNELNRALGRDAIYPLQRNTVVGGFDLDFTFGRVRVGTGLGAGGRTTYQRGSDQEISTWMSEIFFTAGFDVLRFEQLHVFLGTGIGGAQLYVDRPKKSRLFADVQPWEGERVSFSALEVPFEIGSDYFVPFAQASGSEKWMLQFGVRAGWMQQFGAGGWETEAEKNPRDLLGPSVDLSGPRARLVFGLGAQNGW